MSTLLCGHPIECVSGSTTQHCRWCSEVSSLRYQESESTARYLREKEKATELREHLKWALGQFLQYWCSCDGEHASDCKYVAAVRAAEGK